MRGDKRKWITHCNLILRQIIPKFACLVDGKERNFSNGNEAIAELQKEHKHIRLPEYPLRDNTVVLTLRDITGELKTHNEEFVAERKKQFGYEPNPFDGV